MLTHSCTCRVHVEEVFDFLWMHHYNEDEQSNLAIAHAGVQPAYDILVTKYYGITRTCLTMINSKCDKCQVQQP